MKKDRNWGVMLIGLVGGQAMVQGINFLTALIILWKLPVSEYALFVISNVFLNIGSTGSDLNLSNALVTFGSKVRENRQTLSGIYALVSSLRKKLYIISASIAALVAPFVFKSHNWSFANEVCTLVIVLIIVWMQQKLSLRTMVLNIQHDARGVLWSNLTGASTRLLSSAVLCQFLPVAVSALAAVSISVFLALIVAEQSCRQYLDETCLPDDTYRRPIKDYVLPMLPAAVFYLFQGQISVLLIGLFGTANGVAEVGALTRYSQLFVILGVLNGFFVQPIFSRIENRLEFINKALLLLSALVLTFGVVLFTAMAKPAWWLLLLGQKYSGLGEEVPLAFAGPMATYIYGILFTLVISRAYTKGQSWYVGVTLLVQIVFVASLGVSTTRNALLLNFVTSAAAVVVEACLLWLCLREWKLKSAKMV